ncbi:hypothetical protein GHT06_020362 [Daphnia sinensis]|uniref:Uncharacterized protein n=1 Tax=Daphnia sinensis TaxID=1820382 RepID=A0AAD5PQ53_9CRUS|nr:hypothetical protein GHT06_020362 [Daphnia sinensis]
MQAVILTASQLSLPELLLQIQASQKVAAFFLNLPPVSVSPPSQFRPPVEPISQPQAADPTPCRLRLNFFFIPQYCKLVYLATWLHHGHVPACQILVFRVIGTEMILELAARVDQQIPETERLVPPKNEFNQSRRHVDYGRLSILKHLKTQIHSRVQQVRDAYFLYNQGLWEAKKSMTDTYTYIIDIEIYVRGVSQQLMKNLSSQRMNIVTINSRKHVRWIEILIDIDSIPLELYHQLGARLHLNIILDHSSRVDVIHHPL